MKLNVLTLTAVIGFSVFAAATNPPHPKSTPATWTALTKASPPSAIGNNKPKCISNA